MTLKELRTYIKSFPDSKVFDYGLSKPFSHRGSYDEVAFSIVEQKTTKREMLQVIMLAYQETFEGYKGGEYDYDDSTNVNFDYGWGISSSGKYVETWIEKLTAPDETPEMKLTRLAFK